MMTRQEYELDIDKAAYENLLKKAEGNIITKNRYIIPLDNSLILELDIFKGIFDGLIMGEIEFPDEETAKKELKMLCEYADIDYRGMMLKAKIYSKRWW